MRLQVVLVDELPMEFHCALYLQDRSRNANGIASVLVEELPMDFDRKSRRKCVFE